MKNLLKKILKSTGYEIRNLNRQKVPKGSPYRPVGKMDYLLEDLKQRGLDCQTIMDVGANITAWSRMAKKIFPAANFCLIEPQIEMKESLEEFCKEFKNSVYFLAGAGSKKDVLTLTVTDDTLGSSFLPEPETHLRESGKQREIQIITIDDLIDSSGIKLPDLMKLDIQGFELEALKGATKTFGHTEVYILEVSLISFFNMPGAPLFADVINFMMERDYVVYDFPGFYRRPLDGALGQCDICFVKKNGFLRKENSWF
jgi:FkbM family methyltransferase